MADRQGAVTLKGSPFTLTGKEIKVGQPAPECTMVANDLSEVKLSSFKGKRVILVTVPSLDTPVCDVEAKRFNQEASALGPEVVILVVSMDLPFAQKRWCAGAGIQNVKTFSDYRETSVGLNFGVLVKELKLLARAVFIIGREGKIQYIQLVKEIAAEPDYDAVLAAVKKVQ